MEFKKYHGAGNDFILIRDLKGKDPQELAKKVCHRHFGIGADGLMYPGASKTCDVKMTYLNSDGSQATMCGNGLRCFSRFVYEEGLVTKTEFQVETGAGIYEVKLNLEGDTVETVTVNMGHVNFDPALIPVESNSEVIEKTIEINGKSIKVTSLFFGVPHTIVLVDEMNETVLLDDGPKIEKHPMFLQGTNVNFVKVVNRSALLVDTWERGAGHTLACGTGVCASVAVGQALNIVGNSVEVTVPGGVLLIEKQGEDIIMTGGAALICVGDLKFA